MLLGRFATNTFPEEEQAEALRFTRLYLKAVWEHFKHL
jgi:hypothetical protein